MPQINQWTLTIATDRKEIEDKQRYIPRRIGIGKVRAILKIENNNLQPFRRLTGA